MSVTWENLPAAGPRARQKRVIDDGTLAALDRPALPTSLRRFLGVAVPLGIALLFSSSDARADEGPRAITLADALAYARAHQPAIRAGLARVEAERANAEVPRAQWLPLIGATAQIYGATANNTTGTYLPTTSVDIPRIGATRTVDAAHASFQPYGSTIVAGGLTQELFDFGRIAAQSAAADALVSVRKHSAEAARLDVEFNVEEAFFAVHAAKGVLKASEDAYDRAKVHRDLADAGVKSGLRSPIELTRAEADLERFDIGRLKARGGVAIAQTVLAAAVGSPDVALDVSGTAPAPADMPALESAVQRAAAHDPHLLEAVATLQAQAEKSKAIGAELRPELLFTAGLSGRAGGAPPTSGNSADAAGFAPIVPNWDVGAVLSIPLFDGTIDARKRASHALEQVRRDEIDLAKQQLVAVVRQAYVSAELARQTLPSLQRAVNAAIANYAQADARFKAGLGTSVELADAEALRADAEIQVALGVFELARARAALGRAIAEGL